MENQLISFDTAKLAKDKGFAEYTEYQYVERNGSVLLSQDHYSELDEPASTQSLLQRWLREKYKIDIWVTTSRNLWMEWTDTYFCHVYFKLGIDVVKEFSFKKNSYEEALEEGLQKALKLIEL